MKKIILWIIIFLLFIEHYSYSQKPHYCKVFKSLSRPEKCWVITHPFIAKKSYLIAQKAIKASDSLKRTPVLDNDGDGGQVDAFRHTYWMALLTQHINAHKAFRLGKAHEKGNYIDFKKHRTEEGSLPDKISSDMDLRNNLKGIQIGKKLKAQSSKFKTNTHIIQKAIIDSILKGKMVMIRKNRRGEFLDDKGNIISPDSLKGKWKNNKSLVPSNYIRPE